MLHQITGRWRLGLGLSLVASFFWATLPIALKYVLESEESAGLDANTVTWYRFSLSALLLAAYIALRKGKLLDGVIWQGRKRWLFLITALCLCANYLLFVLGLKYLSPSAASVVIQLAPMFLLIGSLFVFKEIFGAGQWAGFVVLAIGMVLFFNDKRDELLGGFFSDSSGDWLLGVLLVIGASLFWAIYALGQKQLLKKMSSVTIMLYIYIIGIIVLFPLSKPAGILNLSTPKVLALIFCGLNTLIAYGSFAEALDHWEASRVSATVSITPLMTIAIMIVGHRYFPLFFEEESLNAISILGGIMVVGGSMLCALGGNHRAKAS